MPTPTPLVRQPGYLKRYASKALLVSMDTESFRNVAQAVQAIVIAAAVLVGGIWALVRARLRDEFRRFPALDIQIRASQGRVVDDSRYYIFAVVEISNKGTRPATFKHSEQSPFCVTPATYDESGLLTFEESIFAKPVPGGPPSTGQKVTSIVVRQGETKRLSYYLPVPHAGVYRLSFDVPMSSADSQEHHRAGVPTAIPVYWTANTYFNVTNPEEDA